MEIKVYYEDTDCGGVVYYANYLKYFERARTEYLETRGCSIADWMQRGVVFVVVHAEAHYYSAGRYGETLRIETDVADVTRATVTFSHVVREKLSNRIVVKGSARLAATDHHGKVRRLDTTIVTALRSAPRPPGARIAEPGSAG
ncbi:MAG: YbgC/FadM family acyl-CoA thioesterase [Nitrospira sp.]|nr:YbgC/FadM family acyl-CoA thioesterase [Nitrospira sp.]